MPMANLVWIVALLGGIVSADLAWASYRDWRARALAIKHAPTLTRKFVLPPD